jgi:cyclohexanecarboxylate-CoA ligase
VTESATTRPAGPPLEPDLSPARIGETTAAGLWRNETLDTYLDRWATRRPDTTAMVDRHGRHSWAELARLVERIAHGLAAHGVTAGSTISVQLPNWTAFAATMLAAGRLGAIVNPIPPTYRASELRFMLGLLESRALLIPATFRGFDHVRMVAGLRTELPRLEHVFVVHGEPGPGMASWATLTETAWERRAGRGGLPGTDPNGIHEVIFTSGTTGEPKGVMHTPNTTLSTIYPLIERLRFSERDVVLMASTLGHQTGYLYGFCLTVLLGATTVWLDTWRAEDGARLIAEEGVTFSMGATPFLQDLTGVADRHDCSSLRLFISAGAPIPRPLVRQARARLGCAISAGWGMTENGLVTCNGLEDAEEKIFGSDGRPLPGMRLRVLDEQGRDRPAGVEGDLLVTGPAQFVGYARRPAFTREAHTPDGWFKTGDRAVLDADGYLSITGRSKDLIIRGGENIPVAEVENLLYAHPKVAGVAVVAMPDPRLQERACAFVVPRPGETLTLGELTAYLEAQGVAKHKFPERLELVTDFPMTPSGKIQKYKLRQDIAARLAAEGEARA